MIVHIIWRLDVGGGEVFLRGLSKALGRRGIAQHIFTIGPRGRLADDVEAAGVPVTASRTGGIPEMLEHGVDGLLVDPGDAPGLAAAVERLTEDDTLRSSCVAHARSRLPAFDVETVAEEYLDVYRAFRAGESVLDAHQDSRVVQMPGRR